MRRLVPLAALALFLLLIFRGLAFTDMILGRGDTFTYFYPYWTARDAFLRAGELPLWTPNIFMGAPLLANPQLGALYPPNWLTIGLDAPDAIRVSVLLHIAWATLGAYVLARRAAGLGVSGALVTAAVFGLGGYVGAHVEQINQLQGLAWFPWLFLLLHRCLWGAGAWHAMPLPDDSAPSGDADDSAPLPARYVILLGMAIALQVLSGHTQTVFISGVGMALYGVASAKPLRTVMVLGAAGGIALLLASPQLVPTYELIGQGSRSGGLDANAALSFSLPPTLIGRGLLPSYDAKLFTEYIAYVGVAALVLAGVAIVSGRARDDASSSVAGVGARLISPLRGDAPHRAWIIMVVVALILALGRYLPVNYWLVQVPGFDLFRVPARWLALYGLGVAVLAGAGADAVIQGVQQTHVRAWHAMPLRVIVPAGIVVVLAGLAFLSNLAPDAVNGAPVPGTRTLAAWGAALAAVVALMFAPGRWRVLVVPLVLVELFAASLVMPYNDLVPPEIWSAQRFTISQMLAYTETDENGLTAAGAPPGRVLSISGLLFDPGDKAALSARYNALGMTPLEERYAFVAAKMKETLTPNLPLAWGIPSVDGYAGGLLPTRHYNTFMQLVYPGGVDVPGDGRLQENLAREDCRGACVPNAAALTMMNVDYLLVDKVFDVWHEGVAYDTTSTALNFSMSQPFEATAAHILYHCAGTPADCALSVSVLPHDAPDDVTPPEIQCAADCTTQPLSDDVYVSVLSLDALDVDTVSRLTIAAGANVQPYGVTLVDGRTGQFQQMSPGDWRRVLSSDIKLYQRQDVAERPYAVIYPAADAYTDDADALNRLRRADTQTAFVMSDEAIELAGTAATAEEAQVTRYAPTRIELMAAHSGMLVIPEAYYPGWRATVNGDPAPIYRANINFRAVPLPAGESHVIFEYKPYWLPGVFIFGGLAWLFAGMILIFTSWRNKRD